MKLEHARKIGGWGNHRTVSSQGTFERILPLATRIGVTRIADITGLDRIGIPVYSAIMPKSNDVVSVYNGKGVRPIDAKVGSLMEAIERYACWQPREPDALGSFDSLRRTHNVLDPREIVVTLADDYTDETDIAWLEGYDLIQCERTLVPYYAASFFLERENLGHLCYTVTSTNGLASGNTLEEAVCHALCEVIERDAWTIADLVSRGVPRYLESKYPELKDWVSGDDVNRFPTVDPGSIGGEPAELMARFDRAQMAPMVRNITGDTGIATFMCTITAHDHPDFSPTHAGVGCHPDSTVAITRALTEAAQARAVDIQGLREDISMAGDDVPAAFLHAKRVTGSGDPGFYQRASSQPINFDLVPTFRSDDVLDDITLMLGRLQSRGLQRAIVVDFSADFLKSSIARVIVPGLESWAAVKGKIGRRADAAIREIANEGKLAAAAKENAKRLASAIFRNLSRPES